MEECNLLAQCEAEFDKSNLFEIQGIFNRWDPKDDKVYSKLMDILDILEDRVEKYGPDEEEFDEDYHFE